MSRSGLSRSPTAGDATRQKLDELDALIQQMLNLPVNRLDPDWPVAPDAGAAAEGQRMEDGGQEPADLGQRPGEQAPTAEDAMEGTGGGEPAAEEIGQVQPVAPSSASRLPAPAPLPSILHPPSSALNPPSSILHPRSSAPLPPALSWWLYPLLGLNLLFDGLTYLLGPLGRWLRGETGRLVVGWAGVALLLAALVRIFAGWMGWIN